MANLVVEKIRDLVHISLENDKGEKIIVGLEHGQYSQQIVGDVMRIEIKGEEFKEEESKDE